MAVVSVRLAGALVAALLLAGERGACAEATDPFADVLNGTVFWNSLKVAAHQMKQVGPCLEPCRAMQDLARIYDILDSREIPHNMARLSPDRDWPAFYRQHEQALQRAFRNHPTRFPLYCAILAKTAAHVEGVDRRQMTWWVIELASRLDSPSHDCLGPVLAALPRTPEESETLAEMPDVCRSNLSNALEGWAWCARFLRRPA